VDVLNALEKLFIEVHGMKKEGFFFNTPMENLREN
jgi:hypothetical protein